MFADICAWAALAFILGQLYAMGSNGTERDGGSLWSPVCSGVCLQSLLVHGRFSLNKLLSLYFLYVVCGS